MALVGLQDAATGCGWWASRGFLGWRRSLRKPSLEAQWLHLRPPQKTHSRWKPQLTPQALLCARLASLGCGPQPPGRTCAAPRTRPSPPRRAACVRYRVASGRPCWGSRAWSAESGRGSCRWRPRAGTLMNEPRPLDAGQVRPPAGRSGTQFIRAAVSSGARHGSQRGECAPPPLPQEAPPRGLLSKSEDCCLGPGPSSSRLGVGGGAFIYRAAGAGLGMGSLWGSHCRSLGSQLLDAWMCGQGGQSVTGGRGRESIGPQGHRASKRGQ